ncbi:hypothetical protein DMP23_47435 [Amycolatopsis sp. A1MSW2902]|uniref:hypothetical protein n=1 Tax=Amycolatopsis sp. A1MSW2902 TaxID=687413 RepID=UPI00307D178A
MNHRNHHNRARTITGGTFVARDKRVVARMNETGETWATALAAIRAEDASRRSATIDVVMHAADGWSDALLAALEKEHGALGFNIVGHSDAVSGEIASADISDDEHGEHIELVLRINPSQLKYLPEHRPLEVELSKTTLARLARRMQSK